MDYEETQRYSYKRPTFVPLPEPKELDKTILELPVYSVQLTLLNIILLYSSIKFQFQEFDFSGTDLSGGTFQGSNLENVNFENCNLDKCDFRYSNMSHVKLEGATLLKSNFGEYPIMTNHNDWVNCVCYSKDERLVGSCSENGLILLWDSLTFEVLHKMKNNEGAIYSLVFSKNSDYIAYGGQDMYVRIYDIHEKYFKAILKGHNDWINSVYFMKDDTQLVTGGLDKVIRIYDIETQEIIEEIELTFTSIINQVLVSPNDFYLASAHQDPKITIWKCQKNIKMDRVLKIHESAVNCLAFTPDSELLASAGADMTIKITKLSNNGVIINLDLKSNKHPHTITKIQFSPVNTNILYSTSTNRKLIIWNLKLQKSYKIIKKHTEKIMTASFSPDGQHILTGGYDNSIIKNVLEYDQHLKEEDTHEGKITAITFPNQTNQEVVTGGEDGTIRVWNLYSGKQYHKYSTGKKKNPIRFLVFQHNDEYLYSGGTDGMILKWDLNKIEPVVQLDGHKMPINSISISHDNQKLVSASRDQKVIIWDSLSQQIVISLYQHMSPVTVAIYSHNSRLIATASEDKSIILYHTNHKYRFTALKGHSHTVNCLSFSHDNKYLVSGGDDSSFSVWDTFNYELVYKLSDSLCGGIKYIQFVDLSNWEEENDEDEEDDGLFKSKNKKNSINKSRNLNRTKSKMLNKVQFMSEAEKRSGSGEENDDDEDEYFNNKRKDKTDDNIISSKVSLEGDTLPPEVTGNEKIISNKSSAANSQTFKKKQHVQGIIYYGIDGGVYMWEFGTYELLTFINCLKLPVYSIGISNNHKILCQGGDNGKIHIWQTKKLRKLFIKYKFQRTINPPKNFMCEGIKEFYIKDIDKANKLLLKQLKVSQQDPELEEQQQKLRVRKLK